MVPIIRSLNFPPRDILISRPITGKMMIQGARKKNSGPFWTASLNSISISRLISAFQTAQLIHINTMFGTEDGHDQG